MKLNHHLKPHTKMNSIWIKDLNISCESPRLSCFLSSRTIKVLEENIRNKISYIPYSNIFAAISPRVREIKEKRNKWDYIKLKSFCTAEETVIKMRGNWSYGKTYLPMILWTRVWFPKYIKSSYDSTLGR